MIIELFGLPGAGKSTYSREWRKSGVTVIRALSRSALVGETLLFILCYPIKAIYLCVAILMYAPKRLRYSIFVNAFVVQNAKYQRARRMSHSGKIVVIDQGPFQSLLSIFAQTPSNDTLSTLIRHLPQPDILLMVEVQPEERIRRMRERAWTPREEFGEEEVLRASRVAESVYARLPTLFDNVGVAYNIVSGMTVVSLSSVVCSRLSYITAARMPTEKAHGISIANMCASFARAGAEVSLIAPTRRTSITDDVWTYYAVPRSFDLRRIVAPDLLSRGWTHPLFFFAQRLLFVWALRKYHIQSGIVYTREPEIAWRYCASHAVVFEAHDWPLGWRGRLQAYLVRRSVLIVCNSEGTQSAARRHGLMNTIVAPNGFSPDQFENAISKHDARVRLGIERDAIVAMYVGALDARKGVQALFDASSLLAGVTVAIVGGGIAQISKLKKEYQDVRFLGFRPYREIADTLATADVLVLPNSSRSMESSSFTSPIKLFAYMASGVPIVASDVPAVLAVLNEQNAILVPADNPDALAGGIRVALDDKQGSEARALRARASVQSYTWDARAERILEAIHASITL